MGMCIDKRWSFETESPYTDIVLNVIGEFMRGLLPGFGGDLDMKPQTARPVQPYSHVQLIASQIHPQ